MSPRAFALLFSLLTTAQFAFSQTGCVEGNCKNGYGTYVFPDGARYVGDFQQGRLHGKGMLTFPDGGKYIGNWVNQQQQGTGRMIQANGDVYFGNFEAGLYHGSGTMTYANGNVLEGQWQQGKASGMAKWTFNNNDQYEGNLQDGLFNGQGTMTFADGTRYTGQWLNNQRHGQGTLYHSAGYQVNGQWQAGAFQTNWSTIALPGDTATLRNCQDGSCATGKGKYYYPDGRRYYGDFSNGQPAGQGVCFFPNGNRYQGAWRNHLPEGLGVTYYAEGRVTGAIWQLGKPVFALYNDTHDGYMAIKNDREPKVWAVVIGAARYNHMPALRYTDDDAYQLFAFLKSPEGGALPDNQIRLLIDEDATHGQITDAMRSLFLRADENDMILFYFSGHGLRGAFLPIDYDGFSNELAHETIRDILHASRARHKLILADACHAGSLLAARATASTTIQDFYTALNASNGGTALLLSSKGEEYSLEDGGLRSGIFSHFLIRGLKGEANTNADRIVTVQELFTYVHEQVRRYTGNVQTPTLTGDFDSNMPVSAIRQ